LPLCEVTEVDGGFRLSGNSPFASGINHSSWAFVAGFVKTPERPKWTFFLLPPSDYEVLDTWHTIGMRGTGSNTIVTDDVFVPALRALSMEDLREGTGPGSDTNDVPLYRLPWVSFAPLSFVTPMLGATQGAFEALRDWTRARITKTGAAMADLPTVQLRMSQAAADIDAVELVLRRAVAATLETERPSLELRARSMRDFACCGARLREAVDVVAGLAGSAGFAEANSIQRYWRDIHFMSTHISMNDSSIINWARVELGLGPAPKQAQY
jgi:3-hydroxy-9,10-secoandrosta-1,3,5(10)-triene-9,17-dione monooxygenase